MSTHANMVKMTVSSVSATPSTGKGDITLNAASTGFQSFADAYGANATVDILITKGAEWEVARNCTYTHSGTTLTRGTWEDSSNGTGAIVADNTAVVSVVATADSGRRWDGAALDWTVTNSPTTGNVTGVVNTMHRVDISGITAARNFVLPAVAAVGDRVGVYITVTHATAGRELIIIGDTGVTINGGSAATEWSRVWIVNECVILRCITANSAWVVEYDGRIPSVCVMNKTTTTSVNNVTYTKINCNDVLLNPHGLADTTNYKIIIRRAGTYLAQGTATADATAINNHAHLIYKNGSALFGINFSIPAYAGAPQCSNYISLAAADYLELYYYQNNGESRTYYGAANNNTSMQTLEVF